MHTNTGSKLAHTKHLCQNREGTISEIRMWKYMRDYLRHFRSLKINCVVGLGKLARPYIILYSNRCC